MKQSKGNFFKDTDGNVILDLNNPQALGYNHDVLINARDSALYDRFLQGTVDVSTMPPHDFADILNEDVMPIAPPGHSQVHLADGSSTAANETALTMAIIKYLKSTNKKVPLSNISVLGFGKSCHGDSITTLSCSDA